MADALAVISYDVSDDRRRRRVAAMLEHAAVRVQRSVFELRCEPAAAQTLAERAAAVLGPGDSLRLYIVGHHGLRASKAWGGLPMSQAQDFYLL